jgi:MscS family membrane protein
VGVVVSLDRAVDVVRETASSPWMKAALVVVGAFVCGRILVRIVRPALHRLAVRSEATWDDTLVHVMATPVSALLAVQASRLVAPWLALGARARGLLDSFVAFGTTAVLLWIAFRAVDVVRAVLEQRPWAVSRPASLSLLAIGGRLAKVVVFLVGAIILLAYFGVSVTSLVAGLGIGGLALALAAQKTVENLFGTLSIGVDQPLHEGDFVRVGDHLGTVEAIGLRSSRIRTLDRTIVTVPNGQLADSQIESYTMRDRIRLACTLGLVYATTAAQLRATLEGLERVLREHPKIWSETIVVRFRGFGDWSLDIEVMAWFETSDWNEFQLIRQEVLLQFMDVVERNRTSFAFPTRTIHVEPVAAETSPHETAASGRPPSRDVHSIAP